ncbi:hypothetical protein LINPERPRIM_LOCUS7594 [Linum perenne]|jgi:hypothetical protein
MDQ